MRTLFHSIPHTHPLYYVALLATVAAGIGILALLQALPTRLRRPLIALVTFLGGLYYAAEFFIPTGWGVHKGVDGNFLSPYFDKVANISSVLGSFSIGLGVFSLIGMHLRIASRRRESWGFSLMLLISFVAMTIFTLLNEYAGKSVVIPSVAGHSSITNHDIYVVLFNGGLASLDSAMFALIGFFIISASYRAFRIRSVEATLLMASAIIVMLGQVTLGSWLTGGLPSHGPLAFFRFENMSEYILVHLNAPAQRAVTFGLALGVLATSLRLWLSLERGLYFDQE
ncbi:MAG: hypothetical protein P4L33_08050 [Capsulimonadaceae bacterium]|nr:hypothetical protein [Capsulimonadaceae bacterium]